MKAISAKCGNLQRIVRIGRAAVLAALLPGLFVPGWTPAAQAQSTEGTANTPAVNPGHGKRQPLAWLRIMAFSDAPVVGADVRVSINGSEESEELADMRGTTNDQGVVPLAVRSRRLLHPGKVTLYRVTVSGGTTSGNPFVGDLSADVDVADTAHHIVAVNPVTTLVSLLLDEQSDLTLKDAQARVREFLGLLPDYDLGMALREGSDYESPYYSPVEFSTEAQAAGGLDVFEAELLQEMRTPSAVHSFAENSAKSAFAAAFIAKNLASGALSWAGGQGAGWVIQASGLPIPGGSGDIAALQQGLANLQSSVDALRAQVAELNRLLLSESTRNLYNQIVVPALALAAQVNGVESDLTYFALQCPPFPAGSTPPPPDPFCTNQKVSITTQLNDLIIQQAYVTEIVYVQDNPTTDFRGMLHLYSYWLAQTRRFFRAADSTKMQNLYNYWDAVLTQAANLKVELLHQNGAQNNPGGQKQLTDFLGNPNLTPPTTGTFQANQATNLKLKWPAVPDGAVVTTNDHTMWALLPLSFGAQNIPGCNRNYNYKPAANCNASTARAPLSSCQDSQDPDQRFILSFYGFRDWRGTPTQQQWQTALEGFPTPPNWMQTLIAQTKADAPESPTSAGFFNILACTDGEQGWTNTPAGSFLPNSYFQILVQSDRYIIQQALASGARGYNFAVRTLKTGEQYFWYQ